MNIRKSTMSDLPDMLTIYEHARTFMREHGNPDQWGTSHPESSMIVKDIEDGQSYVCVADDGHILATFYFTEGADPTYLKIYEGAWKNDRPYGVVHRIASLGDVKGAASFCLVWAFEQCHNLRIDTHRQNTPMQGMLKKNGFSYCGIIHLENGDERIAFQKCE